MCIDPKKKEQMVRIGEKVKAARIKKGLMPQGLCKRAGLPSVDAVEALEAGKYMPCESRMKAIATVLCLDVKELTGKEAENQDAQDAGRADQDKKETASVEESSIAAPAKEQAGITPSALKQMREKLGITQGTAASVCGVIQQAISQWENGARKIPEDKAEFLYKYYTERIARGVTATTSSYPLNADKLKSLRASEHMSQKDIGELLGVSLSSVQLWECGKRKILVQHIKTLSEYFDVPPQELVKGEWEGPKTAITEKTGAGAIKSASAPQSAKKQDKEEEDVSSPAPISRTPKGTGQTVAAEETERTFCRNVLLYIEESGTPEKEFESTVGVTVDVFEQTVSSGQKITLGTALKAAKFFGKSIEEIAFDNRHEAILLREREELMARSAQIKKMLGI